MKKQDCNERLEFLGDAVLELTTSEALFFDNPSMPEGELTKTRASIVCEPALAFVAKELMLGSYLFTRKKVRKQLVDGSETQLLRMLWRH